MKVNLRPANRNDCNLLFIWANDANVRENSFNTSNITYQEHINWFHSKLESNKSYIYICSIESNLIGQVRLDIVKDSGLIDYSIAKEFRGKGYGSLILLELIDVIRLEKIKMIELIGRVKFINIPSQKSFVKAGFSYRIYDKYIEYYKNLDTVFKEAIKIVYK